MQNDTFLNTLKLALEDKKGLDIQIVDLRERAMFTDYFLIVTGTSTTHVAALAHEIDRTATVQGITVLGIEGMQEAHWVLLDLGDVLVHVFLDQTRGFYNLEKLWSPKTMVLTTPDTFPEVIEG